MPKFYVQYLLPYNIQLSMKLLNMNIKWFYLIWHENRRLLQDSKVLVRDQEGKWGINAHSYIFGTWLKYLLFSKKNYSRYFNKIVFLYCDLNFCKRCFLAFVFLWLLMWTWQELNQMGVNMTNGTETLYYEVTGDSLGKTQYNYIALRWHKI